MRFNLFFPIALTVAACASLSALRRQRGARPDPAED